MANYTAKEADLRKYGKDLIAYALRYHTKQIIDLLQTNGIQVPANIDSVTLHAMVLKAMVSSNSFKQGLITLLQTIALEGEHKGLTNYANQTGCTPTTGATCTPSGLSNDTIDGIVSTSIGFLAKYLTSGNTNANIKTTVAPPPPQSNTFEIVMITIGVAAVTGLIIWKLIGKRKAKNNVVVAKG